ncbi:MAG: hypothetical protein GY906_27815 [bacterium]|nr:hypothetical protein [bacterium]
MIPRVLDVETSLHNVGEGAVGTFKANPHHPANWIVWLGIGDVDRTNPIQTQNQTNTRYLQKSDVAIQPPEKGVMLVGHNIKYDLEMLANQDNDRLRDLWLDWIKDPDSRVWDTSVAEWRLRGQSEIAPSLDYATGIRGWPTKPGRLKEYWDKGISTEDIPDEEVDPYLSHDINSTGRLFLDQVRAAQIMGMLPLLEEEMGATLTLTAGELNGMPFDKKAAMDKFEGELADQITKAELEATKALQIAGIPPQAIQKLGSNPMLSTLIYGGDYTYEYRLPLLDEDGNQVYFKSGARKGMPRNKIHKATWSSTPHTQAKTSSVDEEDLKKIKAHKSTNPKVAAVIDALLAYRKLKKQATTYYVGYSNLTWDHDGMIHGALNQTIAVTGRLSSSAPNLQNAEHGPVRMHFVSREKDGRLGEIDLTQIEIVVQGILSQDPQMLHDLHAGIDFHSKRAALVAAVKYELVREAYLAGDAHWTHERKDAKVFSFQRSYGAGPAKIATTTGMEYRKVVALIEAEEKEYPGTVAMTDGWETEVAKSAQRIGDDVLGMLTSPTGARYVFKRDLYKGKATFKPTEIKNYPIQGLAGDIMKIILNRIRKVVYAWSGLYEVYFINTVHDSLIFDIGTMTDEEARRFFHEIHHVMTVETEQALRSVFNLDFQGLIKADVDIGSNWYGYDEKLNPLGMTGFEI